MQESLWIREVGSVTAHDGSDAVELLGAKARSEPSLRWVFQRPLHLDGTW